MNRRIQLGMLLAMLVVVLPTLAQGMFQSSPVHFSTQQRQVSPSEVEVVFTATIDAGWHVYSTGLGDGGPTSAVYHDEGSTGAKLAGALKPQGKEIAIDDPVFDMPVRYFERQVTFVQKYQLTGGDYHIKGYLEYGACNDQMCMPPTASRPTIRARVPTPRPPQPLSRLKRKRKRQMSLLPTLCLTRDKSSKRRHHYLRLTP